MSRLRAKHVERWTLQLEHRLRSVDFVEPLVPVGAIVTAGMESGRACSDQSLPTAIRRPDSAWLTQPSELAL